MHKWITDSCNDIYDELVQKRDTRIWDALSFFLTAGFDRISGPQAARQLILILVRQINGAPIS